MSKREWWLAGVGNTSALLSGMCYAHTKKQPNIECVHVIEATPAALVADELVEVLGRIDWIALGYSQGLVRRRHDVDDGMKALCAKNGERFREILALIERVKARGGG